MFRSHVCAIELLDAVTPILSDNVGLIYLLALLDSFLPYNVLRH